MKQLVEQSRSGTPEEIRKAVSHYESVKGRNMQALQRYEIQNENPTMEFPVHVVQVGDIAFNTSPFETYMDYMHRIQARSPFVQTFVAQLAAQPELDNGSYLPTERGLWGKGFGASVYDNQVTPEAGQIIVEETVKTLCDLY